MQQLTGIEAGFLTFESPTAVGHVSGVLVLDPATSPEPWTFERLHRHMASRLDRVPITTRKLAPVPLGLDRPYWIPDADFDLDYHLRHIAVPGGGGREALADQVARLHARPLDRARPLWEMYLIEGLAEGRVALMTKVHHAAIDGLSGVEVLAALVDLEPDVAVPAEVPPFEPDGSMDHRIALGRAAVRLATTPVRFARAGLGLGRALPGLGPLFGRSGPLARGDESWWEMLARHGAAPRLPFNGSIGRQRRFAYSSVPLADVKTVKNALGVTVNDVVLAVVAGVLEDWLQERGGVPDRPLVAMVPVSVRTEEDAHTIGNFVTGAMCTLATHITDPAERLRHIHEGMRAVKEEHGALPAAVLSQITAAAPPALAALAARLVASLPLTDRVGLPFNLIVSNVPGPSFPLYLAGARIMSHYPLSVLMEGAGLNVTVMSTNGMLDFGFVGDRDLLPDIWEMADAVRPALDRLLDVAVAAGDAA